MGRGPAGSSGAPVRVVLGEDQGDGVGHVAPVDELVLHLASDYAVLGMQYDQAPPVAAR